MTGSLVSVRLSKEALSQVSCAEEASALTKRPCHPLLQPLLPVVRALGAALGPDWEVVLHDVSGGDHAIVALEKTHQVVVLTQNIDGFHRRAGSHDLIEIHGNLFDLYCGQCGHEARVPDYSGLDKLPPPCPKGVSSRLPQVCDCSCVGERFM